MRIILSTHGYSEADKIYFNEDSSCMFRNFKLLNEINFHEFDLSRVANMEAIFYGFWLKNLDLSFMDLSNVTNVEYMFQSNTDIEKANFEGIKMEKIEYMNRKIFYWLNSLKEVNLSWADFSKLKNADSFFWYSNSLTWINLSHANFSSLISANSMFDCSKLEKIDLSYSNFSSLTTNMYLWTAKNVDLKFADFRNFQEPYWYPSLFWEKNEYIDLEWTNFSSIRSMKYWFQWNWREKIKNINFSWTILSSLNDMSYMFQSNNSLEYLDFSHTDLGSVEKMEMMFSSSYWIKYVNFSWSNLKNLNNVKQMFSAAKNLTWANFHWAILTRLTNVEEMFNSSYNHTELLNVDFWEAKLWTTLNSMFKSSMINNINFSGADFSNVVDAWKLFYNIPTLIKIDFTNIKWANKITNMESMFYWDNLLTWIDLSNFDLSKVKNMYWMFQSCYSLKNINFWDSKIKPEWSLYSMFENNYYLTSIDLSNFDTSEVTDMAYMFASNYSNEELDLSTFDTSKVTRMNYMFNWNRNLKTIYVSNNLKTTNVENSENMFNDDNMLVWWNWTTYNSEKIDKEYAVIDDENNSWYFTNILDKRYTLNYVIDPKYLIWNWITTGTYTPRNWAEFKKAAKPWYELEYWYESWHNEVFVITENTRWDKTLYPQRKAIEEKAQESATENVTYTNETTVTIWTEVQDETINNSSMINLVSKEVEQHEVKEEENKTKVQESEIQVTSDKTVEYQWWLEVYLEKTTNIGEEETKERIEWTAKFSSPVAVKIPITSNAETVKVQVKHEWEEFWYKGLTTNPINSCVDWESVNDKYNWESITVKDSWEWKYVLIYTCSASTFVAYTENKKSVDNTVVATPSAWGWRSINTISNTQEQEHNSADINEQTENKASTTTTGNTVTVEENVKKYGNIKLTRWEVAVMTNILLDVFPQLVEWKQELDDVENACSNYVDEQKFTKDEKKAITRLCKLSIMWIHAHDNRPLEEFLVNNNTTNDEFSKVINRSISTYNEKDLSAVKDALKKLENNEDDVVFWTLYDMFMSIKNIVN